MVEIEFIQKPVFKRFCELSVGRFFKYCDKLYMVINSYNEHNAFCFSGNYAGFATFRDNDMVLPQKVRIISEDA